MGAGPRAESEARKEKEEAAREGEGVRAHWSEVNVTCSPVLPSVSTLQAQTWTPSMGLPPPVSPQVLLERA